MLGFAAHPVFCIAYVYFVFLAFVVLCFVSSVLAKKLAESLRRASSKCRA